MKDLNGRIQQLTKLILTSQTVDESKGDESRPGSPVKVDFDMSPYQVSAKTRLCLCFFVALLIRENKLQQELLSARRQIDSQANQILSLEAALEARPALPPDASVSEKDQMIAEQSKTIRELEIVVRGYEDNLGEPLRAVREDVEREWEEKVEEERKKRRAAEVWGEELVKALEKEKKVCGVFVFSTSGVVLLTRLFRQE
jgi:centromeric protein E